MDVRFKRRVYAGRVRYDVQSLRVVGIRDSGTGQHHFYITNLPVEKLAAEDIRATYALRWQIELLFKELKRYYRIDHMPSSKRHVVEILLYAAILTLIVSRRLLALVRASPRSTSGTASPWSVGRHCSSRSPRSCSSS